MPLAVLLTNRLAQHWTYGYVHIASLQHVPSPLPPDAGQVTALMPFDQHLAATLDV